ncbi:MAG TPA: 50S ribosomal protein L11 methyltransferase [Dehalococcoidia bacterium]|nr:50S ribosomal protein L11 methyltransferase [Dehalococcoidia bacterium]
MREPRGLADATWLELAVEVAGIDAELAADLLRQACPGGVAIESASRFDAASDVYVIDGDAAAVVRGYLTADADADRVWRSLRLALGMAPLQTPPRWRRVRRLREQSWRDAWKKHFGVQRIGRALVVKPSWTHYRLKGGEIVIEIDPGMAFGTGQHPTTAMCLRALEEFVRPGDAVLDLGCGSGILGIAAARLGAARVLALDVDPNAVKAASENAAANGVAPIVEVREGTLAVDASRSGADSPEADEAFDIIAANISALALERLAPALARSLAPDGVLITSGFLADALEDLNRAYGSEGLNIDRVVEDGVWRAIVARAVNR